MWTPLTIVDIGIAAVCPAIAGGVQLKFHCGCTLTLAVPDDTDQLAEARGCTQWHFGLWRIGMRPRMKRHFHGTPLESGYLAP